MTTRTQPRRTRPVARPRSVNTRYVRRRPNPFVAGLAAFVRRLLLTFICLVGAVALAVAAFVAWGLVAHQ